MSVKIVEVDPFHATTTHNYSRFSYFNGIFDKQYQLNIELKHLQRMEKMDFSHSIIYHRHRFLLNDNYCEIMWYKFTRIVYRTI